MFDYGVMDVLSHDYDGPAFDELESPDYVESSTERATWSAETARRLSSFEAGPVLASWIGTVDIAHLGAADLMLVAHARERQRRFDAAWDHDLLAAVHAAPVGQPTEQAIMALVAKGSPDPELEWEGDVRDARGDELATRLGVSPVSASNKIAVARQLAGTGRLAAIGNLLRSGQVSESHARLVAVTLESIDDDLARAVESAVIAKMARLTYRQLDAALKRTIARLRHLDEDALNTEARAARRVTRPKPWDAGMASLEVFGPAEDLEQLWITLTGLGLQAGADAAAAARISGSCDRPLPLDAQRFDALMALADSAFNAHDLPKRQGRRPSIQVTVALSTLLDLDEDPAELEGYGPIIARTARRIAADPSSTWRRLMLDEFGIVGDYGTTIYRPPQNLIDLVVARDRTCTFPACTRPASESDIDHQIPCPQGPTSEWNNHALCPGRHHPQKTLGIWTPTYDPATGDTVWTHMSGYSVRRFAQPHALTAQDELRRLVCELRGPAPAAAPEPAQPTQLDDPDDLPPF
ncbi:MAG: hypothetical protein JWN20_1380 [Jatrophihabitantaceae bacterium]|nr:hypothetical protein [Jatrophihabitantaceae bacterium]